MAQAPQIYRNWRRRKVDDLSVGFIGLLFLGDISNFVGSLLTHQLATQKFLGAYFVIVDIVVLSQFVLYGNLGIREGWRRWRRRRRLGAAGVGTAGEERGLLGRDSCSDGDGVSGNDADKVLLWMMR